MNGYEYTRQYFNWAFENPEFASPNTAAVYFFILDLWNRNGGEKKPRFTFCKQTCKEALGIKDIRTLNAGFNILVEKKFITIHREAKNQNTSWILSLAHAKNAMADVSALDMANVMADEGAHATADVSAHTPVIEQETKNKEQETIRESEASSPPPQNDFKELVDTKTNTPKKVAAKKVMEKPTFEMVRDHFFLLKGNFWETEKIRSEATKFFSHYETVGWIVGKAKTPMQNWKTAISGWVERAGEFSNNNTNGNKRTSKNYDDLIAENLAAFSSTGEGNNSATGWYRPATD